MDKSFDQLNREFEHNQENLPGGPGYQENESENESCAKINGANGNCPLDRKTCSGCRYN